MDDGELGSMEMEMDMDINSCHRRQTHQLRNTLRITN